MRYTVDIYNTKLENGNVEIRATVRNQDGKAFRTTYTLTSNELRSSHDSQKLIAHHEQRTVMQAMNRARSA